jgi:fumarylacetoacetate (FAA) hydrolase
MAGLCGQLEDAVKLATVRNGTRDGQLVIVSRDLRRAVALPKVWTLQAALDDWIGAAPSLEGMAQELESGRAASSFAFEPGAAMAPLPRAYHWADGSAYVNHVELVRKARGADMPPSFWTDPLVYQGGSDDFLGAMDDAAFVSEAQGIDFEAEIAVITDDVPLGTAPEAAGRHIRLLVLVNDWSLRNLIPAELAKGFGFYLSKPATAFSPIAVTPEELGGAWDGRKLSLPLRSYLNGEPVGWPDTGADMTFAFPELIAHVVRTRNARAGTIVGSGTVSNRDGSLGFSCIAEQRAREQIEHGAARTGYLGFGDRVRIEMLDAKGESIFGAIDQRVVKAAVREGPET